MFHHLDPQLEPAVARAVEQLRNAANRSRVIDADAAAISDELGVEATADEVRALCEVTSNLIAQMLVGSGDWPAERYVDGLIPISVDTSEEDSVELAGGAIVSEGEQWLLEPLLARFVVTDGAVSQFVLLFGHGQRDATSFDPESDTFELEFPNDEDEAAWRYSFSAKEEPLTD